MCVEFADKIFIFPVLERWLLKLRETDSSFVLVFIKTTFAKVQIRPFSLHQHLGLQEQAALLGNSNCGYYQNWTIFVTPLTSAKLYLLCRVPRITHFTPKKVRNVSPHCSPQSHQHQTLSNALVASQTRSPCCRREPYDTGRCGPLVQKVCT